MINNSYGVTRFDGNGKQLDIVDAGGKEFIRYTYTIIVTVYNNPGQAPQIDTPVLFED